MLIGAGVVLLVVIAALVYWFNPFENKVARTEPLQIGIIQYVKHLDQVIDGFKQGLTELGYEEGVDVVYTYQNADGDAAFIAKALGDIARAKGMSQVARDAGLSREILYKALSGERSPDFDTILKVVGALGLKLHAEASHG